MYNEFKSGILFTAIGKYSNVLIQLVVNAILSRILTPQDYGIVAVVNVFLLFFQMIADFGIGPAIIQNKDLTDEDIQDIFSFTIIASIFLGIVFMFLGYPLSWFLGNPVYIPVAVILGICVVFNTLLVVPQAIIQKAKNFKFINVTLIGSHFMSGLISVVAAYFGASYYALIFGNIIKAGFLVLMFYRKTDLKLVMRWNLAPIKKIYAFSRDQFIYNFINYFSRNLDSMLIGARISPTALAYYDKAYQLSLYPNIILTNVITPVVQPIMADYEQDKRAIERVYLQITKILAILGIPLTVFLVFSSPEIIFFMFGDQWEASVLTFRILGASVWLQMISSSMPAIFQSANRTDLLLKSGLITAVINVTCIVSGVLIGSIEAVASLLVLAFALGFLINNYLLMKVLFKSTYRNLLGSYKSAVVIAGMVFLFFLILPEIQFGLIGNLAVKGGGFVLLFLLGLVWTGELRALKEVVKK